MNLGISNSQVSTWKRIKTQHIVAAAGIALAVSTLAGSLTLRTDNPAPSAPPAAAAVIAQPAPQPETFVYLVGSQAEAAELQNSFVAAVLESDVETNRIVMVIDSAEAEAGLGIMQGELALAGGAQPVHFVDFRTP